MKLLVLIALIFSACADQPDEQAIKSHADEVRARTMSPALHN